MTEGELLLLDGVLVNPESRTNEFQRIAALLVAEIRRLNAMVDSMCAELLK